MFEFTEDCILGVESIDEEHRHLFDLINQGCELLYNDYKADKYEDIKDLLGELEEYADQHFANEEAYMVEIRDPELILQRSQHMFFREEIREFLLHNIDDEDEQREVLTDIMNFLARWLYHHILSSDILIGKLPPLEEWMVKENPCEFSEEYMTGIDMIDREHKLLFELVENANNLAKSWSENSASDDIIDILKDLREYARSHFSDEEEYMRSINYEGLDAQKRAHDAFIAKLDEIKKEDIENNPREYLATLISFLLGWLVNHILHTDKKIPKSE